MAFVAFGKKKVSNPQQQQQQQQQLQQPPLHQQQQPSGSDESHGATRSFPQQQYPVTSVSQSDLEGFRLAEAEADAAAVFRDEVPGEASGFGYEVSENVPGEQLVGTEEGIAQLLEHNLALRRNFDNLKQLHLHLTEANSQLQEAYLKMQAEKARVEGGLMHHNAVQHDKEVLETELQQMKAKHLKELDTLRSEREELSGFAVELEQRYRSLEKKMAVMKGDNKELNHQLDVLRYGYDHSHEKDNALNSKHTAELEYARELSLVKVEDQNYRQQAADLAHKCKHLEIDLEKAISAGETVHQQLVSLTFEKDATIMDLDLALRRLKDEYKLRDAIREENEQKLKESAHEIVELRTLLNVLEKSSSTAEAQYLEALKETKKECDILRTELAAALAAQREAADRLVDMDRLRNQLGDALAQNRESASQIAEYRNARDEASKKMEVMRLELGKALAVRGKEQAEHTAQLQNLQRKWAEEKSALLRREEKLVRASKNEFSSKYKALKKFHTAAGSAPSTCRASLRADTLNRGLFEADMKELSDRQAKFLAHSPGKV
ncbi:hypothetical protein R1sor_018142 [Riccia sorocarpa]|uniref:Uncharacterized protein n=1 Tax=Riccia sorocarpa TaxID=122646 RepID=A0ABD3ICE5_9MARC